MRYHSLDALRAIAMFFGIAIHAVLPYTDPTVFQDLSSADGPMPEAADIWHIMVIWIHQWRMPVFFILAGFFGALMLERRGRWGMLKDRGVRIFLALVVLLTLLTPLTDKQWAELHHLWFLWFLVQFYAVQLALSGAGRLFRPLLWIFEGPWRLALLLIPMVPLVLFAKHDLLYQIIPLTLWEVRPSGLVYYAFFFGTGIALWHRRERLDDLARLWMPLVGYSLVVMIGLTVLGYSDEPPVWPNMIGIPTGQLALIFGLIGMAHALIRKGGPVLTFLVDSAYAVYIVHLYIVLIVAVFLIDAGFSSWVVVPASIGITVPLCLLTYVVLVRYTPFDWLLAGYKNARFKWPFSRMKRAST